MRAITLALAFLLIACATPEPGAERVEVQATQLADRVVAQTAEAPVPAGLTAALTPAPMPSANLRPVALNGNSGADAHPDSSAHAR